MQYRVLGTRAAEGCHNFIPTAPLKPLKLKVSSPRSRRKNFSASGKQPGCNGTAKVIHTAGDAVGQSDVDSAGQLLTDQPHR